LIGKEWTPIGDEDNPFTGELLGNYYTISNMTISGEGFYAGLFGVVSEFALIDSVNFENPSIRGRFDFAGTIAGISWGSTIIRVSVNGASILVDPYEIMGTDYKKAYAMVGGLVGCSYVDHWAEEGAKNGYAYALGTVTISSFSGTVGTWTECNDIAQSVNEMYLAYGGIVGYGLGAAIHNTRADVTLNINSALATLSHNSAVALNLNIMFGGIAGIIDREEIEPSIFVYPIIQSNLAIVSIPNIPNRVGGIIGHTPMTVQLISGVQWIQGNYFYSDSPEAIFGGSSLELATVRITSVVNLKKKETYKINTLKSWDIGEDSSIWLIDEGESAPTINFTAAEPVVCFPDEIYKITNVAEFKLYYEKMTSAEDSGFRNKKYWLSQTYELEVDINIDQAELTQWVPIGYDQMFRGVFDGKDHKIFSSTNFKFTNPIESEKYKYRVGGFFGMIAPNATVKNLSIENFIVDYAEFTGGLAAINAGTIENCYVRNFQFLGENELESEGFLTVGLFVGYNEGRIINPLNIIEEDEEDEETEEEDEEGSEKEVAIIYTISTYGGRKNEIKIPDNGASVFAGGIVGYNKGTIEYIKIEGMFTIAAAITEKPVVRQIGGAVGYNVGKISECSVEGAYISDSSKVNIYLGGLCGINDGEIIRSHAGREEGGMLTSITAETAKGQQLVGGLVAKLGPQGEITQSFANVSIKAYFAGGFAGELIGKVSECYVKGMMEGQGMGGFAGNLTSISHPDKGGEITNSYTMVSLKGTTNESILAGIAVTIRHPGNVENCFISTTFSGLGAKYYESYSDTRTGITNWFTYFVAPDKKLGKVNNIVINTDPSGQINSEVQTTSGNFEGQKVFYTNTETCKGGDSIFKEAKFSIGSDTYWTIEEGDYPILTFLTLDNIPQIIKIHPLVGQYNTLKLHNGTTLLELGGDLGGEVTLTAESFTLSLLNDGTGSLTSIVDSVITSFDFTWKSNEEITTMTITTNNEPPVTFVVEVPSENELKFKYSTDPEKYIIFKK
jgi:hypothetical protein